MKRKSKPATTIYRASLGSSGGEESACNAGDPGLIPGLGRSSGEGIGSPLQYSGLENYRDCVAGLHIASTFLCMLVAWNLKQISSLE